MKTNCRVKTNSRIRKSFVININTDLKTNCHVGQSRPVLITPEKLDQLKKAN